MSRDVWIGLLKSWTRFSSFIGKEITEVLRRPGVVLSLVLGPFLIMALFGIGYSGERRPLETVVVVPTSAQGVPQDVSFYQEYAGPSVNIVEVTSDVEDARRRLVEQRIDLLVVTPENPEQRFLDGEQSPVNVEYNQIDPIRDNYARFVAQRQIQELNRAIVERMVGEGKAYALEVLGSEPVQVPASVVAAPTRPELRNWAPITPTVVAYYAPAVLALILQHMAVTLTALSLVRERMSGAMDIFRVAPVRTLEILLGKYLAYGFFNLAIGALTSFLLVGVLGTPFLGDPWAFAGIVVLLTFASLGLGLLISSIVDSERQAVQLSMLVLLASVFFSGFVLPLEEFIRPVRWFAYSLPVTHGIRLLQDTMLRGGTYFVWQYWALLGVGVALFAITGLTLRRTLRRADI